MFSQALKKPWLVQFSLFGFGLTTNPHNSLFFSCTQYTLRYGSLRFKVMMSFVYVKIWLWWSQLKRWGERHWQQSHALRSNWWHYGNQRQRGSFCVCLWLNKLSDQHRSLNRSLPLTRWHPAPHFDRHRMFALGRNGKIKSFSSLVRPGCMWSQLLRLDIHPAPYSVIKRINQWTVSTSASIKQENQLHMYYVPGWRLAQLIIG